MAYHPDRTLYWLYGLAFYLSLPAGSLAEPLPTGPRYLGRPIFEVLEQFREQGYPFAYSTSLVPDTLLVLSEPVSHSPLEIATEILEPHGLELKHANGIYLVIRGARDPPSGDSGSLLIFIRDQDSALLTQPVAISTRPGLPAALALGSGVWSISNIPAGRYELAISTPYYQKATRTLDIAPGENAIIQVRLVSAPDKLEVLSVSASRYLIFSNSLFFIDQRAIENLPVIGDDPIRTVQRLPGIAAGGWSAKSHFRGGEENESAIFLNGLQLLDPFHVRDFHNIFSSIDARTISGIEAYTGGFPVEYGDRMSGLLLLQSSQPEEPRHYELGVSFFNTSLLSSGYTDSQNVDWMVSARKSNLGLFLDKEKHGEPDYYDVFGTLGLNISSDTRLTMNILQANDNLLIITENKSDDREQSTSKTRNTNAWVQLLKTWPSTLSISAVLSGSSMRNERSALAADPTQLIGFVEDNRKVDIQSLRVDFEYLHEESHILSWGVLASRQTARFDYRSRADYSGFYLAYPGVPESLERDIQTRPSGYSYAAYVSDRFQPTPELTINAGLRWDKQTYTGTRDDTQISPRISMLYTLDPKVDVRLSWGRFHQSQGIGQLQVEDGVEHYFPAQQADQLIAGLSVRFNDNWSLRSELYQKNYNDLRLRFENLLDPVPLIPELAPDRIALNPSSGRARGLELTLEYNAGDHLNWWTSYTLSRVTDRIDGVDELRNWDQTHSLQAGFAWRTEHWEYGFAANIHSGWPTTLATLEIDDADELELVFAPRNQARLNTFASFDVKASRIWQFEKFRITAFVEVSNLFNRQNECCADYDINDEDEQVPLLERSVDSWLGIVPALGVLLEF